MFRDLCMDKLKWDELRRRWDEETPVSLATPTPQRQRSSLRDLYPDKQKWDDLKRQWDELTAN